MGSRWWALKKKEEESKKADKEGSRGRGKGRRITLVLVLPLSELSSSSSPLLSSFFADRLLQVYVWIFFSEVLPRSVHVRLLVVHQFCTYTFLIISGWVVKLSLELFVSSDVYIKDKTNLMVA